MNTGGSHRAEALFAAALGMVEERRAELLRRACGGDRELREEVESLLAAHAEAADFLEAPAGEFARGLLPERESFKEEKRCGPYKLIREIGRGGMGEVYLAARADDQYENQVAIKLVRRGLDMESIVRRFRRERQILAGLNHPNIARLLDGGSTEEKLPWFALEYVRGKPLTEYCDEKRLSVPERLRLFLVICDAVQHAHRNLVVHRDLKPGNILITEEGIPKLLDFGVAKLLQEEGSEPSPDLTQTGMRPMTPAYASLEQARREAITTASDVYSLGVILYELLTGHRPYQVTGRMTEEEVIRAICEQKPLKPSARVALRKDAGEAAGARASAEEIGRLRGETPDRLRRLLAGDLDDIVMMALRKESDRRYDSVARFAEDILLHLDGKPVTAAPDTYAYRARKLLRRYRIPLVVAVGGTALLVGLTSFAVWNTLRANAQERETKRQLNNVLATSNALLGILSSANARGPNVKFVELADDMGKQVDAPDVPLALRIDVHHGLGQMLMKRGDFRAAEPHVRLVNELSRQLLGENHERSINSIYHLGIIESEKGNKELALKMIREAAGKTRQQHPKSDALPWMLLDLGGRLGNLWRFEEAEPLLREAREIAIEKNGGDLKYAASNALCNLGNISLEKGEIDRAEGYYRQFLEEIRLLPERYQANEAWYRLGQIALSRGDLATAEKLILQSDALFSRHLGDTHPQVVDFLYYLSSIHSRWKDHKRAEAEAVRAIDVARLKYAPDNVHVVMARSQLCRVLMAAGQRGRAIPCMQEVMNAYRTSVDKREGYWVRTASNLAECLALLKRYPEAERLFLEAYSNSESDCSNKSPFMVELCGRMANLYHAKGKPELARRYGH